MIDFKKIKQGSVLFVRTNFGTGIVVRGTVVEVEKNIKNGLPGIVYEDKNGEESWAYSHQIDRVEKY